MNQFYGHNHKDWFQMFYDTSDFKRPLNFGFVTPAVTSRDETNPVYRIYTVDGDYEGSSWVNCCNALKREREREREREGEREREI